MSTPERKTWLRRLFVPTLIVGIAGTLAAGYLGRDTFRLRYWSHVAATESSRRSEAIAELNTLNDSRAVFDALVLGLDDQDPGVRHGSALVLGYLVEDLSLERLGAARYQTFLLTAKAAWSQEQLLGDPRLLGVSVGFVGVLDPGMPPFKGPPGDPLGIEVMSPAERRTPARLLLEERPEDLSGLVRALRTGPAVSIRYVAAYSLGMLSGSLTEEVGDALRTAVEEDPHVVVRRAALRALLGFVNVGEAPRPLDARTERLCRSLLNLGPGRLGLALAAGRALAPSTSGEDTQQVRRLFLDATTLDLDAIGLEDALFGMLCLPPDEALVHAFYEGLCERDSRLSEDLDLEPLGTVVEMAVLRAVTDPAWIRETLVNDDTPRSAHSAIAGSWVRLACLDPERAMKWLLDPRAAQAREVVSRNHHRFLAPFLARAPKGGELAAVAARTLTSRVDAPPMLASLCVEVLVAHGGDAHVGSLESFAQGGELDGPLDKERALAGRAAAFLRGELPEPLRRAAASARTFLGAHLGPDGQARPDRVHPADHPCALQGHGIPHLEHRTALACLALLSQEDAPALLAASIRFLSDPENDDRGFFRTYANDPVYPHELASTSSVGSIPRGLEESFVLWALRRAVARGIEGQRARAAIERRVTRLLAERISLRECEFLVLGLAVVGDLLPSARARALAFRKAVDLVNDETVVSDAAAFWLGPKVAYPALRRVPTSAFGLPVDVLRAGRTGDPWLSTVALSAPHQDPDERRAWLWRAVNRLSFESSSQGGTCPGAVVPNAQEDPVILTAWNALACEAIEGALSGR